MPMPRLIRKGDIFADASNLRRRIIVLRDAQGGENPYIATLGHDGRHLRPRCISYRLFHDSAQTWRGGTRTTGWILEKALEA